MIGGRRRTVGENPSIVRRREEEDKRFAFQANVARDFKLTHQANWEVKTDKIIDKNKVRNITKVLRRADESKLAQRREKLAAMLSAEEEAFKQEIAGLTESSSQRAKRMAAHAREAKQEREAKRQGFVQEQYLRQWRDGCDDLRTIDSDRFLQHCHEQIAVQRTEREQAKQGEQAEEERWARLWEEDRLRKVARENEEGQLRTASLYDNRNALLSQMDETRQARSLDAQQVAAERDAFQAQMARDAESSRRAQAEEIEEKRRRQGEIVAFNNSQLERKKEEEKARKAEERRLLAQKTAEYDQETNEATADKKNQQRDMREFKEYLEKRRQEEAKMEAEMERLTQADLDKANQKRDVQWMREALARQTLMKEVYAGRTKQIEQKEQDRLREEEEMALEREATEREIEKARMLQEMEDKELRDRERQARRDLEKQIQMNANRRAAESATVPMEREFAAQAENTYRNFLQTERVRATSGPFQPQRNHGKKGMFTRPIEHV